MSVRAIEAEVSIKSGVQAECTIGREVIMEVHDDVNLEALTATENGSYRPESGVDGWDRVTVAVPERQPVTEPLSVIENGRYIPAEGVDGFSDVTVQVPERIPVTESLSVTENGLYEPTEGIDGYNRVSVAVPERIPVTESLTATSNGVYEPDSGVDGYNHVTVAVPERRPDIESLTVTANGTYESTKDGYNPVVVKVPERQPITESLSVTENGTYTPPSDVDGFNSVTVDVPSSTPKFTLIGQSTHVLPEYTDTSKAEVIDTGINIKNTDYLFLLVIITCDGVKTNAQDWGGLTIGAATRYTGTKNVLALGAVGFREKTLSLGSLTDGLMTTSYGVYLATNVPTVKFQRKIHASACPKIMAGTYTVKVYGLDSL